jgi:hypothetical protein
MEAASTFEVINRQGYSEAQLNKMQTADAGQICGANGGQG